MYSKSLFFGATLVASAAAFAPGPMGVLPSSSGRAAALSLRQPAGALRMAGGPPAGIVKMLDFQSKVMGVVYSLQGKEKPFTLQMRDAAMALHTFSQAPREGKVRDMTADTVVRPVCGPDAPLAFVPSTERGSLPQRAHTCPRHPTVPCGAS